MPLCGAKAIVTGPRGLLALCLVLPILASRAAPEGSNSSRRVSGQTTTIDTNLLLFRLTQAFSTPEQEDAETNTATFRFGPPDGTRCTEDEVKTVHTYSPYGVVRPEVDEQRFSILWTVRNSGSHVSLTKEIKSFAHDINGRPFNNPAAPVLKGLITTDIISHAGNFQKSSSNKDVMAELKKNLPQPIPAHLEAAMKNTDSELLAKTRWDKFIEPLIGRTVRPGQFWERDIAFPGGAKMYAFEKILIVSPSGSRLLVSMFTIGASDPKILQRFPLEKASSLDAPVVNEFLGWIATGVPLEKLCLRRILDANTMLPVFEEHIVQTVRFRSAQPVIITERTKRRFDYK